MLEVRLSSKMVSAISITAFYLCFIKELFLIVGVQPGGDAFYGISPDARYIAYPPPAEFSQPTGNGTLRRGQHLSLGHGPVGVPPDVTVLHNPPIPPPPLLSTFSYPTAMETEGHLVWPSEQSNVGVENSSSSHIVFQLRLWSQCLCTATNQTSHLLWG